METSVLPAVAARSAAGPVLVLAAHPDDRSSAPAMLAWHASRPCITVVHATDGARGDRPARAHPRGARREGVEACAPRDRQPATGLPDGELPEHLPADPRGCRRMQPRTLLVPRRRSTPRPPSRGHRRRGRRVADRLPLPGYSVNFVPPAPCSTSPTYTRCYRALQAYASQNAYIDLPGMSEHRCRAATVNLDIRGCCAADVPRPSPRTRGPHRQDPSPAGAAGNAINSAPPGRPSASSSRCGTAG
jgi:hypothetical protein